MVMSCDIDQEYIRKVFLDSLISSEIAKSVPWELFKFSLPRTLLVFEAIGFFNFEEFPSECVMN